MHHVALLLRLNYPNIQLEYKVLWLLSIKTSCAPFTDRIFCLYTSTTKYKEGSDRFSTHQVPPVQREWEHNPKHCPIPQLKGFTTIKK